jgi:hypothetical protein
MKAANVVETANGERVFVVCASLQVELRAFHFDCNIYGGMRDTLKPATPPKTKSVGM